MLEVQIARIAERIKQRRSEMGLSIREAAKSTGTSPSTIQKIESNEMVPSIAILMKIAQGLKQPVTLFFEDGNEPAEVALMRSSERKVVNIPASKLKVEDLGASIIDANLEVTLLAIAKSGESGKNPLIHEGKEIKLCLEGKIAYFINDHEYHLDSGDCIDFKSNRPHYWKNIHTGTTRVLSVVFNPLVTESTG